MLKRLKRSRAHSATLVAVLLISLGVYAADREGSETVGSSLKAPVSAVQVPTSKPQELADTAQSAAPVATPLNSAIGEQVKWQVISSGGNRSSSTNYVLNATVAQTAVGTGHSANYGLSHGFWQESSAAGCCNGRVGNANGVGTYPNEVTISDIQTLVTAKFIVGSCAALACLTEADVNQSGGANPKCTDITISDVQTLVNHLFIAGPVNAPLKSCL